VVGDDAFLQRTREALDLMKETRFMTEVQRSIAVIRAGRRSGMRAWLKRPTFVVGKRTWQHSAIWYAGAIAHDSHHSRLYREAKTRVEPKGPPEDAWTGQEAERKCLAFQLEVLGELKAGGDIVRYLRTLAANPTYQGHNKGWKGFWDYLKRNW
jgi:hypothetical protein